MLCWCWYINKLICKTGIQQQQQKKLSEWKPPNIALNGWGKWESFQTRPSRTWSKNLLKHSPIRAESVCNYLQSLINTARVLADLLKQRHSVHDVHDFISKTIHGYSFEGSLERMSTLFPLHPRMNPKMAYSTETSGCLWTCHLSQIIGRWQLTVSSWLRKHMKAEITPGLFRKRYLRAERRKQRHPSSLGKKAESSTGALGQNKQENKRGCFSSQTEIHSNALQLIITHVLKSLSLAKRGEIRLTYKIIWS